MGRHVAIIGSGPSAAAVALAAAAKTTTQVTIVDIGRRLARSEARGHHPNIWPAESVLSWHRALLPISGLVPEKSYFGNTPSHSQAGPEYVSDTFGGLTKWWGASFLPLTPSDMSEWPIPYSELHPYFTGLLDHIPISGQADGLSRYFTHDFFNSPPMRLSGPVHHLIDTLTGHESILAGTPRLAVSTSGANACTYCGQCFYGCYHGSIYSADMTIQRLLRDPNFSYVRGRVTGFRRSPAGWNLQLSSPVHEIGPVDNVFVAAGCLGSTELVARFFGLTRKLKLLENPVYWFMAINDGQNNKDVIPADFGLSNALLGIQPEKSPCKHYIHIQLYPASLYLWRHVLLKVAGSLGYRSAEFIHWLSTGRIYIGLLYLDGSFASTSTIQLLPSGTSVDFQIQRTADAVAREATMSLRRAMHLARFELLGPPRRIAAGTSAHYVGPLAMGSVLGTHGEVEEGLNVVDGSVLPSLPAQNITFSIMANAYRIADHTLG